MPSTECPSTTAVTNVPWFSARGTIPISLMGLDSFQDCGTTHYPLPTALYVTVHEPCRVQVLWLWCACSCSLTRSSNMYLLIGRWEEGARGRGKQQVAALQPWAFPEGPMTFGSCLVPVGRAASEPALNQCGTSILVPSVSV